MELADVNVFLMLLGGGVSRRLLKTYRETLVSSLERHFLLRVSL